MVSAEATSEKRLAYQPLLRVLGARLDEMSACQISVTEVAHGFSVRYRLSPSQVDAALMQFRYEDLRKLEAEMRRCKPSGRPGSYQDVLRALGYELEQVDARDVVFDEMNDGFLVTSCFPGVEGSWQKRAAIFGPKGTLLEDAYARRRPRPRKRGLSRLLGRS